MPRESECDRASGGDATHRGASCGRCAHGYDGQLLNDAATHQGASCGCEADGDDDAATQRGLLGDVRLLATTKPLRV